MNGESELQRTVWSVEPHSLTESELRLAQDWLGPVFSGPRLFAKTLLPAFFITTVTFSLTMAIGSALFTTGVNATRLTGLIGIVLALTAGAITIQRVFVREQKDNQHQIARNVPVQRDINARNGEVISVKVDCVVEIAPFEDEGKKYCFRLTGDSAVMLRIPDDDNPDFLTGNALFPNRVFTIIRLPTSKLILCINCIGESLPIIAKLPARVDKYLNRDAEPFKLEWSQLVAGKVEV